VLHELLTGRRPFSGATVFALARQHEELEPTLLRELRPDVDPALERLVLDLLENVPTAAPPTETPPRTRTGRSRPPICCPARSKSPDAPLASTTRGRWMCGWNWPTCCAGGRVPAGRLRLPRSGGRPGRLPRPGFRAGAAPL